MSVDWAALNARTANFRALQTVRDPNDTLVEVVFAGLQVSLKEILTKVPAGGGSSLTVYADTLEWDLPSLDVQAAVVVARRIVLPQGESVIRVGKPPSGATTMLEVVAGETPGLAGVAAAGADPASAVAVPAGTSPLNAVFVTLDAGGALKSKVRNEPKVLRDVLGRGWALNSLRATYAAATWLLYSDDAENRDEARRMLMWVAACAAALDTTMPSDFRKLYDESRALLVAITVQDRAAYVPALSSDLYRTQVGSLIDALQSVETAMDFITTTTEINKALERGTAAFADVTAQQAVPLNVELKAITENVAALGDDISQLTQQFLLQEQDTRSRVALLRKAIAEKKAKDFAIFMGVDMPIAFYKTALDIIAIVVVPEAVAAKQVANAAKGTNSVLGLKDTFKNLAAQIQAVSSSEPTDKGLLDQSLTMMQTQLASREALLTASMLFNGIADDPKKTPPASFSAVTVDPNLAWNNYMHAVDAMIVSFESAAAGPAAQLRASMLILAEYGKAIDTKCVTLALQLARGRIVKAQIAAAADAVKRLAALQKLAKDDQERLALVKAALQSSADAMKASVFVAWTAYRAAYFYVYLVQPPISVNMGMSSGELKTAVARMSQWVAQVLGDSPDKQSVKLPTSGAKISFTFDVYRYDSATVPPKGAALLTPRTGTAPATLSWCVPIDAGLLKGTLPKRGKVAVWITEARFVLHGMRPNDERNVIMTIGTSGTYDNWLDATNSQRFVTKSLVGNFAYSVTDGDKPKEFYSPWRIDPAVYTTPSPYTQWTLTFDDDGGDPANVSRLTMDMEVAYR